jgi:uncharacterized protein YndB with AHSA1/START domain
MNLAKTGSIKIKMSAMLLAIALVAMPPAAFGIADDNPLVHEGIVEAPIDEVWAAFTTREGLESWMAAHAEIELKIGGKLRTHYDPKGEIGDPKTIENTIICYDPKHMIALKVSKPPEGFAFPNAVKNMWTIIYFEAVAPAKTKVREVGLGFGNDDESKKMRAFFDRGNAFTLQRLQRRFAPKTTGE